MCKRVQSQEHLDLFRCLQVGSTVNIVLVAVEMNRRTMPFDFYAKLQALVEQRMEIILVQLGAQQAISMHCSRSLVRQ